MAQSHVVCASDAGLQVQPVCQGVWQHGYQVLEAGGSGQDGSVDLVLKRDGRKTPCTASSRGR